MPVYGETTLTANDTGTYTVTATVSSTANYAYNTTNVVWVDYNNGNYTIRLEPSYEVDYSVLSKIEPFKFKKKDIQLELDFGD